jgi:hypothetical protein
MPESEVNRSVAEREIRDLQLSIDQSNLRRAAELSMPEKFRLGADLYDDGSHPTRNAQTICLILDETRGLPESLDRGQKKPGQICGGCNWGTQEPDCLSR